MTIYLENISKEYNGIKVIDDLNVAIEDNKCYEFIGPKGCGKSTVLKIFMGLIKPDSGKVSRMGDYKYPTLQSAYVSQESVLNPKKNALWNVTKSHRTVTKKGAKEELSRFFSDEEMTVPLKELAEGSRRKIEIIRAMFVPADFIVLDEPFTGMSITEKNTFIDYIMDKRGTRPLLIASREEQPVKAAKIIRLG
ncbi:MAG: ATP-binding cassette domain-containing protein [Lachnospiraceae bacterium]|nr:ATP-binding cassette domain-containing protein [Lachnospiraceae bacterium]